MQDSDEVNSAPLFSREKRSIWGAGSGTGSQASDTAKQVSPATLGLETTERSQHGPPAQVDVTLL